MKRTVLTETQLDKVVGGVNLGPSGAALFPGELTPLPGSDGPMVMPSEHMGDASVSTDVSPPTDLSDPLAGGIGIGSGSGSDSAVVPDILPSDDRPPPVDPFVLSSGDRPPPMDPTANGFTPLGGTQGGPPPAGTNGGIIR